MYLHSVPMKETYYLTHQEVAKFDSKALWIDIDNICYVLSEKQGTKGIEVETKYNDNDVLDFCLRFNGVKRSDNFETPIDHDSVYEKLNSNDIFEVLNCDITKEEPIYIREKNHYFYPYFISGTIKVKDNKKFSEMLVSGYGRSKRLGFGLFFIY